MDERRRAAVIVLLIGVAFTAAMLFFSWFGEGVWLLMYGVVIPLVPFVALAAAALSPRFPRFYLYGLAVFFVVIIGVPAAITYVIVLNGAKGGANFAVGCYYLIIPFAVPLAIILGLALAAESGKAKSSDRPA